MTFAKIVIWLTQRFLVGLIRSTPQRPDTRVWNDKIEPHMQYYVQIAEGTIGRSCCFFQCIEQCSGRSIKMCSLLFPIILVKMLKMVWMLPLHPLRLRKTRAITGGPFMISYVLPLDFMVMCKTIAIYLLFSTLHLALASPSSIHLWRVRLGGLINTINIQYCVPNMH